MKRAKRTCTTALVLDALRRTDDLVSTSQLATLLRESRVRVYAALWWLRRHRAVDVVIEVDGTAWWFARPACDDDRVSVYEERAIETAPRRPRRMRKKQNGFPPPTAACGP